MSARKASINVLRSKNDRVLVISEIPGSWNVVAGHVPGFLAIHEVEVLVSVVQIDRRTPLLISACRSPG